MICFLPPLPAAPRPEQPSGPATPDRRATEAVLLIVIVMNVFFMLAAFTPPLLGTGGAKPARTGATGPLRACKDDLDPDRTDGKSGSRSPGASACHRV